MNLRRQVRSSIGLWLSISAPVFFAFWFVDIGKGGEHPVWELWRELITRNYVCSTRAMLLILGNYTLLFASLAVLLGWVLHLPVVLALDYFRGWKSSHDTDVRT